MKTKPDLATKPTESDSIVRSDFTYLSEFRSDTHYAQNKNDYEYNAAITSGSYSLTSFTLQDIPEGISVERIIGEDGRYAQEITNNSGSPQNLYLIDASASSGNSSGSRNDRNVDVASFRNSFSGTEIPPGKSILDIRPTSITFGDTRFESLVFSFENLEETQETTE